MRGHIQCITSLFTVLHNKIHTSGNVHLKKWIKEEVEEVRKLRFIQEMAHAKHFDALKRSKRIHPSFLYFV